MRRAEKTRVTLAQNFTMRFKQKDTIMMFTSLYAYAVKGEKMKTKHFMTQTLITLTHNPHPLTFEPSQHQTDCELTQIRSQVNAIKLTFCTQA